MKTTTSEQNAAGWMLARHLLTAITQARHSGERLEDTISLADCRRYCADILEDDVYARCVSHGVELADIRRSLLSK
jgi:hypothetical protein